MSDIKIFQGTLVINKWKKMLTDVKPDAVFIATNWNNHAKMAIESMNQGAHAFVEVPIAVNH